MFFCRNMEKNTLNYTCYPSYLVQCNEMNTTSITVFLVKWFQKLKIFVKNQNQNPIFKSLSTYRLFIVEHKP